LTEPDPDKAELRASALARRDALAPPERDAAAQAVAARAFPVAVGATTVVAGYSPIRSEFDPFPLMRALAKQGARLALPAVVARDAPLQFRVWAFGLAQVPGTFGIGEPAAEATIVEPDVFLLPVAAFDRAGHRIGYGAGYYDRTLAELQRGRHTTTVGLAFSTQEVARVPALPHDIRLDYIATEHETIAF
jgi:5-formyltetrahydrofolate cyclo-ligase